MITKKCSKCKVEKSSQEFGRCSATKSGLLSRCKLCREDYRRAWSKSSGGKEKIRLRSVRYWRNRNDSQKQKHLENGRKYSKTNNGRISSLKRVQKWKAANPRRAAAHWRVKNAIRDGKINRQPCEICRNEKSHAHHDDYSKPLDVMWLCPQHHKDRHRWLTQQDYMI